MATFYIEAIEDTTITLSKVGSPVCGDCYYGIDDNTVPNAYTYGSNIALTAGQKCYFVIGASTTNFTGSNYLKFTSTNKINVGGYLSDLIGQRDELPRNYCFCRLFYNCTTLVDASNLVVCSNLNSKTYCYDSMFENCTLLVKAPELPAMLLTSSCYNNMFGGCTSLTTPPVLPATIMANSCYCNMFVACTSLTSLPDLPATSLESLCYGSMFSGCTSIKVSETQTGNYRTPYRIPPTGTATEVSWATRAMFSYTGGTFTGTPTINTTYYLWKDWEVTTIVNPEGSGTVTDTKSGDTHTLTATPNPTYSFTNWLLKGYTQLEYIESNGTQYVDTGVYPTDSIVIKMKFKNIAVTGNTIIGNNGSGESDTFRFFNFNSTCYLDYGSGLNKNRIYGGTCSANTVYEFELGNRYVKNIQTGTNIISGSSVSFAQKSFTIMVNGASNFSSNAFYYIKIYDNDTLVRDFIPVIRHSDGAIGLLDLVNLKFYGNSGSGVFIGGPVKEVA